MDILSPELQDRAQSVLQRSGYPQLAQLDVTQHNGRIVLTGRVRTYYMKQLAQSVVMNGAGVQELDNKVEVC